MRHKHADMIIAWANGAKIQARSPYAETSVWVDLPNPSWDAREAEYRIKPEPKPDVEKFYTVYNTFVVFNNESRKPESNLKLTWDGETEQLKGAQVL